MIREQLIPALMTSLVQEGVDRATIERAVQRTVAKPLGVTLGFDNADTMDWQRAMAAELETVFA